MKSKLCHIVLLLAVIILLSGCATVDQSKLDDLETRVALLEEQMSQSVLAPVDPSPSLEATPTTSLPEMTAQPVASPNVDRFKDIKVTIIGKNVYEQKYNEFIEIVTTVENNTSKDIKGIEGILHINDMFGKKITDFQWDITQDTIPAGESITVTGFGFEYNQFMDAHKKIYSADFENLQFSYDFQTVIFTDGTTIK